VDSSVDGVILAAGLSTRAGQFKLAMKLGDKTLIEHAIGGMYPIVDRVIVVGGYRCDLIRDILRGYERVEVVFNERYEAGMFTSVKTGLRYVTAERFFLLPGDHPLVGEEVYRRLLAESAPVVRPAHRGYKGHPLLMDSRFIPAILAQPDSANLRDFIRTVGFRTVEVGDERIFLDVDTAADYEAAKRAYDHEH